MPANKDRLYVALYARGGKAKMPGLEDTLSFIGKLKPMVGTAYHWALIVGPKTEGETRKLKRFHAIEKMTVVGDPPIPQSVWRFEEQEFHPASTILPLARILICKVQDRSQLEAAFRNTPLRGGVKNWNCVEWVKEALRNAAHGRDILGTSVTDWNRVRGAAMQYVERKKAAHRYDGQSTEDPMKIPTWDLIQDCEVTR